MTYRSRSRPQSRRSELTEPAAPPADRHARRATCSGRLPADEVPASLRAVARFTPASGTGSAATALAAALDGDDGFREAVGRVVEATSPDSWRRCATAPTPPPPTRSTSRWSRTCSARRAGATRWRRPTRGGCRERDHSATNRAELERLRADLARAAGPSPRRDRPRTREAVAAARDAARTPNWPSSRKTLRDRTRELRQAERERDAALDDRGRSARPSSRRRPRRRTPKGAGYEHASPRPSGPRRPPGAGRGPSATSTTRGCGCWSTRSSRRPPACAGSSPCPPPTVRPADTVESAARHVESAHGRRSGRAGPAARAAERAPGRGRLQRDQDRLRRAVTGRAADPAGRGARRRCAAQTGAEVTRGLRRRRPKPPRATADAARGAGAVQRRRTRSPTT